MEISEFSLKVILLLVPGATATIIFEKLTTHKKWNSFQFVAHSILFGALSYLLIQLLSNDRDSYSNFWNHLADKNIPFKEIAKAFMASIFIGFISSAIDYYKLINRTGKFFKLTNKFGDESLNYIS